MSDPSHTPSATALARYACVSLIDGFIAQGYENAQAVEAAVDIPFTDSIGRVRFLSTRTLYRWHASYKQGGLAALEIKARAPLHGSRVFPQALLDFVLSEHDSDPQASIPELIRRAKVKGRIHPDLKVRPGSLWRVLKRMGVDVSRKPASRTDDLRRFTHSSRMRCVLVDGKHFRAGLTEAKRVVLYFLDDATRFGLAAIVGPSESAQLFLHGLHTLIRRFGLPSVLFTDHGSAFVNDTVKLVLARLGLPLINGAVGHPEGRGKIERFNRSVNERVLRTYRGNPAIDPDCQSLSLRLEHDLLDVYNHLPHASLNADTPLKRWDASSTALEPVPDDKLQDAFTLPLRRRISNDHVVKACGKLIELPRGYAGKSVTLYRRVLENDAIYLLHEGRMIRLREVQPELNANTPRAKSPDNAPGHKPPTPSQSASSSSFATAFAPLVGPDGGFKAEPDE